MSSPRLTIFHAQMGSIKVGSAFAYIAGYDETDKARPSVEWAGVAVDARVVANGLGSDRALLKLAVTSRDVLDIPHVPGVTIGRGLVEMPATTQHRIDDEFVLAPGEAVLFLSPEVKSMGGIVGRLAGEPDDARVTLILVEVTESR